jgi:hypothetical protein
VGIVMIKCPQTGRAIPTGIKADHESFRRSAVFFARTHCSICQTITTGSPRKPGFTNPA